MLEDTDRHIVELLAGDGRMSFTDIAKHTGLSVSAAHQRVRRLELKGVLRGFSARLDPDQIGLPLTAFVALTPIDLSAPDTATTALAEIAAVEACYSVAGTESYLVKVRIASPAALEELLAEIRARCQMATRTTVVLSTAFEDRPPALPA